MSSGAVPARGWLRGLVQRAAATRVGGLVMRATPAIDRRLLRASGGRFSLAIGYPMLLLTTTGARSGVARSTPVAYSTDGENITLVVFMVGSPTYPAWLHNVRKNPRVSVLAGKRSGDYLASEAQGAERERLWARSLEMYRGYEDGQRWAGERQIPVVVLTPIRSGT